MPCSEAPAASCTAYGSVPIRSLVPGVARTTSATEAVAWSSPPISSTRPVTAAVAGNWTGADRSPTALAASDVTTDAACRRCETLGRAGLLDGEDEVDDPDPQPATPAPAAITQSH